MAVDGASGVAAGITLKAGVFGALFVGAVSLVATLIGFTIVPLAEGRQLLDATRRLCAGLLSSFILGPLVVLQVFERWPGYLTKFVELVGTGSMDRLLYAYLAAASPFIALSGIVGFWLVAAWMRFFTKREDKDVLDIAAEVRDAITPGGNNEAQG